MAIKEKNLQLAFNISLFLKGLFALGETIAGVILPFISLATVLRIAKFATQEELTEDPHDVLANFLFHSAQRFSLSALHFAAIYLLIHGAVKLWLVIGLLRERLWYYPVALTIFTLFAGYQIYLWSFSHSVWLFLFTIVDFVVIALTWHEYRYLRRPHLISAS